VLLKGVRFGTLYKLQGSTISDVCNSSIVLDIGVEEERTPIVSREKVMLWNDQGIKFCSKIQSSRNRFKLDENVGLVVVNPTQLVSSQTDVGSERYCNLFIKSNRQKKNDVDCTVRTVHTG
jgi:hypothetical protein